MDDKKKMNDLAHTLRKHGLAASSSDAIRLASNVENTQKDNDEVHKKKFGDDLAIKSSPTEGLGDNMSNTLSKDQIVDILQQFSDKFCAEINSINAKLQDMEANMASQPIQAPEPVQEQAPEPVQEQAPEPVQEQAPEPVQEQAPEPVQEQAPVQPEPTVNDMVQEPAEEKPKNPQDDMMDSVDLVDTFNVNKK